MALGLPQTLYSPPLGAAAIVRRCMRRARSRFCHCRRRGHSSGVDPAEAAALSTQRVQHWRVPPSPQPPSPYKRQRKLAVSCRRLPVASLPQQALDGRRQRQSLSIMTLLLLALAPRVVFFSICLYIFIFGTRASGKRLICRHVWACPLRRSGRRARLLARPPSQGVSAASGVCRARGSSRHTRGWEGRWRGPRRCVLPPVLRLPAAAARCPSLRVDAAVSSQPPPHRLGPGGCGSASRRHGGPAQGPDRPPRGATDGCVCPRAGSTGTTGAVFARVTGLFLCGDCGACGAV